MPEGTTASIGPGDECVSKKLDMSPFKLINTRNYNNALNYCLNAVHNAEKKVNVTKVLNKKRY